MVDVRRDVLRPPHCTTPAAVKAKNASPFSMSSDKTVDKHQISFAKEKRLTNFTYMNNPSRTQWEGVRGAFALTPLARQNI